MRGRIDGKNQGSLQSPFKHPSQRTPVPYPSMGQNGPPRSLLSTLSIPVMHYNTPQQVSASDLSLSQ